MNRISICASGSYDVVIGNGLLPAVPQMLGQGFNSAMIVCGNIVSDLYGNKLTQELNRSGIKAYMFTYKAGEQSKNMQTLTELLNYMAECGLNRNDVLITLGGGVTGDLGGLAAALYQRGIAYYQIPTSLLAMVDSSVGGKTAVNIDSGKNMVGVFKQPEMVYCDISTLNTLPLRFYNEGMAEVIKYSFLSGEDIYSYCDFEKLVSRCVEIKRDYVEEDEYDKGSRRLLNFGHTIGHAVERLSDYNLLHGEAVSIGMYTVVKGCVSLGICEEHCVELLKNALERYNLPTICSFDTAEIMGLVKRDKKCDGRGITAIIPKTYGLCEPVEMSFEDFEKIVRAGLT